MSVTTIPNSTFHHISINKTAIKNVFCEIEKEKNARIREIFFLHLFKNKNSIVSVKTVPDRAYDPISNKAAVRVFSKEIEEEKNARTRELCYLEMFKNTNSFELDKRADDLSNLIVALLVSIVSRENDIKSVCKEFKQNEKDDKLDTKLFTKIINMEQSNLKNDFVDTCFPGNNITFDNFKPKDLSNNSRMSYAELFNQFKKMHNLVIEKAANYAGCHIVDHNFKLQYRDLETHEIRTSPRNDINCMRYAFYLAHEKKLAPWIFEGPSTNPFDSDDGVVILQKMQELGYTLATQAQRDDLIFYMDKNHRFTHMGKMFDATTVHSKWGSLKRVVSHPVKSIPKFYDNYYMLLRKAGADHCTEWTLDSSRFQATQ